MPEINGVMLPFMPAGGIKELKKQPLQNENARPKASFNDVFRQELDNLKFSAHAQARLESRDIALSSNDVERLQSAVGRASEKGANESLIMMDEKAFIVSIPNRTVITVMDKNQMGGNIITDIDSAIFA